MDKAPVTGGCYCGDIRYKAGSSKTSSAICYCEDCRRLCGAQSVAWLSVQSAEFSFTKGNPVYYASSPGVTRTFCGKCGTTLTYQNINRKEEIDITTSSLDTPTQYPPTGLVYASKALAWDVLPALPVIFDPPAEMV